MNRQMIREQRKDRKKINKKITDMIRRATQKDEEQIIEFASNQTPMWEILLCYQYQSDKQIQSLTAKVLQNILFKVTEEIGFSNTLTHNTTITFDERCATFLAIVRSNNHDMDEISTGTLYYLIQLFEEFLEEEKLDCIKEAYKEYRQMILNIQMHNILPIVHLEREKLIKSCKEDISFAFLAITTWLFLHECSLLQNLKSEWISGIDTLEDLFQFLEIDNLCIKDILLNDIEQYSVDRDKIEVDQLEKILKLCQTLQPKSYHTSTETTEEALEKDQNNSKDEAIERSQNNIKEEINNNQVSEENDDLNSEETRGLVVHLRYCFEIQNEIERIMSYYCSIIIMTHEVKEKKSKDDQIEKLLKQVNKIKKSQEKQKEQIIKQNEQLLDLEKKLKLSKQEASPVIKENNQLKIEISTLKNQVSKLKSHIEVLEKEKEKERRELKEEKIIKEDTKPQELKREVKREVKEAKKEVKNLINTEEAQWNDIMKELNKHKITILGGPARFARRVKEFLPHARVIDMGSKFGEIRIGSSDYVVVYWKMLGHARTMQVEAQIKGSSTKIIYVDSTNKYELCKTIYENL